MKTLFTLEQKNYLEKNVPGKLFSKVTQLFNQYFKTDFSIIQIKNFCMKNGIKSSLAWTPEIKDYVKKNYEKVQNVRELVERASEHFGMTFRKAQISNFLWREGISYGHGLKPAISKPLYSERKQSDGCILIKVAMTGTRTERWQEKHRWIWEQANGKIPKGMNIIVLDNNPLNCTLENLAMVSRAEKVKLAQFKLRSTNREITLAGIAVVKHLLAIHSRLKKMIGIEEHERFLNKEYKERRKKRMAVSII
jgi:hypothetical protein